MELLLFIILTIILALSSYTAYANYAQKRGSKSLGRIFVDTSVLIDGRIVTVAETGFIGETLSIPRSVIGELQLLADSSDSDKRTKARRGLDVITELQELDSVTVEIFADKSQAREGVDERLLAHARKYGGAIATVDYNLNKVATVEGIRVLNINDLAMSLRMAHNPGEEIEVELTTKGNNPHQGVGHLKDGTMVVVEHAKSKIGQTVRVEIIRGLQTSAGRMMFARLVNREKPQRKETVREKIAKSSPKAKKDVPQQQSPKSKPNNASRPPKQSGDAQPSRQTKKPRQSRKPKTSQEREASLVDLINNS